MGIRELKKQARATCKGRVFMAFKLVLVYIMINLLINSAIGIGTIVIVIFSIPFYLGTMWEFMLYDRNEEVSAVEFIKAGSKNFGRSWAIFFSIALKMILPVILYAIASIIGSCIISALIEPIVGVELDVHVISEISMIITYVLSYIEYTKYSLTKYICLEDAEIPVREAIKKSKELMQGKRKQKCLLQLSFIGWYVPQIILTVVMYVCVFAMFIQPIVRGDVMEFFRFLYIAGIVVFADIIYISFITPYVTITNIKFYNECKNVLPDEDKI